MNDRRRRRAAATSLSELTVLTAFLDDLRATVLWKLEGLDENQARASLVASGTSLIGIVKHLAFVERHWFQRVFAGREVWSPWTDQDPDADWRVERWESVAGVADFYRGEIEESRRIVHAARDPDTPPAGGGPATLRWILVHMIQETARHAGHADLLREAADGATGV